MKEQVRWRLKTPGSIQAMVMDMDGTLLNEHNEISPQTLQMLMDLQKQGVKLVLASGRSYPRLLPYANLLKMQEYGGELIEIDGVGAYDLAKNERVKYHTWAPEEIQPLYAWLMQQNAETQAVFDDGLFCFYPKPLQEKKEAYRKEHHLPDDFPWTAGPWAWLSDLRQGYPHIQYANSAQDINVPINKLQIMQEEEPIAQLFETMQKEFADQYSIYRTTPRQLEVLPLGFSKGEGVRRLMKKHGWDKEKVLVFGDGENDVSMFEAVPHSFAMANAKDYVQKHAKHTAGDNKKDGLIEGLLQAGYIIPAGEDE